MGHALPQPQLNEIWALTTILAAARGVTSFLAEHPIYLQINDNFLAIVNGTPAPRRSAPPNGHPILIYTGEMAFFKNGKPVAIADIEEIETHASDFVPVIETVLHAAIKQARNENNRIPQECTA